MNLNWQDYISILGPLLGLIAYVYHRIEKKADERQALINDKFEKLAVEIKEVNKSIQSLDSRISRIEGQLNPRPYWEPKIKEKED